MNMSKLVAYFSCSGTTRRKAEQLAERVGADLFEIRASEPYTSADVRWWNPWSRCVKEHKDETCVRKLRHCQICLESMKSGLGILSGGTPIPIL